MNTEAIETSFPQITWEAVSELLTNGGIGELAPEEAFSVVSDAVNRPISGGVAVDPGTFDPDALSEQLLSAYADATVDRFFGRAESVARSVREDADLAVGPALCRASGLPPSAYRVVQDEADMGNRALLTSMYSRFLESL